MRHHGEVGKTWALEFSKPGSFTEHFYMVDTALSTLLVLITDSSQQLCKVALHHFTDEVTEAKGS